MRAGRYMRVRNRVLWLNILSFLSIGDPFPWSDVNQIVSAALDDLAQSDDQIQCYEFIYHVAFTHKDNLVWLLTWLSLGLAVLAVIVGEHATIQ